ncbi:MAG: hypothetical protein R3B95_16500 [Nitrospirales bacterium]|nr:hypothetical protein [Nitrospirales bacterium]
MVHQIQQGRKVGKLDSVTQSEDKGLGKLLLPRRRKEDLCLYRPSNVSDVAGMDQPSTSQQVESVKAPALFPLPRSTSVGVLGSEPGQAGEGNTAGFTSGVWGCHCSTRQNSCRRDTLSPGILGLLRMPSAVAISQSVCREGTLVEV